MSLSFRSPGALNPNSRQMEFFPHCTKVVDDVLFVSLDVSSSIYWHTAFGCIHMPSLVISTPLPGGSLSVTKNPVGILLPKSMLGSREVASYLLGQTKIYSIPANPPTRQTDCFVIKPGLEHAMR